LPWAIGLLLSSLLALAGCAGLPDSPGQPLAPSARLARQSPIAEIAEKGEAEVQIDLARLPDLWARLRAGFALPELDTPDVERFAERFAATNWLEKLGPRARRYLYLLVTEAEKQGVPTELALLPIIESGLNPLAQSPAAAVGLCQFIPATGRRFGLQQSSLADRRKDLACVDSMYEYLAQNARKFGGDWLLALAGYNWGEGAVARAIERNARDGQPGDYLSLRMPIETRAYVPQLLALKKLILEPERYGIRLPPVANLPTLDCDVAIPRDMDVALAARLAGITEMAFRQINAGVTRGVIPKTTHPSICLPFESAVRFIANVSEYKGNLATLTTHTVLSRTTLSALAKRYRTTPEAIREANDIGPGMRLKTGATVLVPKAPGDRDIPANVAASAQTLVEPDVPDTRKLVVRTQKNDSLASLSRRHKVNLAALLHWNPGTKDPLKTGQPLVLHVPLNTESALAVELASGRLPVKALKIKASETAKSDAKATKRSDAGKDPLGRREGSPLRNPVKQRVGAERKSA
jgi:membrane-bound lytic murein transglycosylase D